MPNAPPPFLPPRLCGLSSNLTQLAVIRFTEPGNENVRIIGFPEHQFSAALSATAEFAALTEFTFSTLIQRTLGIPFDVRSE